MKGALYKGNSVGLERQARQKLGAQECDMRQRGMLTSTRERKDWGIQEGKDWGIQIKLFPCKVGRAVKHVK